MPHQCLKCGKIFEQGSTQLLKGCSECGGNRFFYTKEPLDEKQRQKITEEVGKDINETLIEIMGSEGEKIVDKSGKWVNIKPKDIRKAMEKHLSEKKEKIIPDNKGNVDILTDEKYRRERIDKIKSEMRQERRLETIGIERPGSYKIDIKGLLEEEPIIIQKDGSYTIHLPSLFKMIDKEK
ncbi:MAG: Zn-ribbon domain-containing protein [Candidatus Thermoplasmatota archaeon]|nr:Zn-ribbon domain-containing protein [Candidatus Thermoplasmatota archaeon]